MSRRVVAGLGGLIALLLLTPSLLGQPGNPPDQGPAQEAYLNVRIHPKAKLDVQGRATQQTGELRRFVSPPLVGGKKYTYTLVATWTADDGKPMTRTEEVQVYPGRTAEVDLLTPKKEDKPADAAKKDDKKPADAPKKEEKKDDKKPADAAKKEEKKDEKKADDKKPEEKKDDKKEEKKDDKKPTEAPTPASDAPAITARGADDKKKDDKKEREPDVEYVPTPHPVVEKMLEIAGVKKEDIVYDLGCGDGRIPVAAAKKYGCKAFGYDIDPERVKESQENIKKDKVGELVTVEKKDIFTLDLSKATVVTLYLLPELNVKLIPQLEKLKPGSRIVSHDFDMRGVEPDKMEKIDVDGVTHKIYLWTVPLKKKK